MKIYKIIRISNFIFFFTILLFSCQTNRNNEEDIYLYLETCFENYYRNFDVDIHKVLHDFEIELIQEKHLKDSSGASYKLLFKELNENIYFQPPLKKGDFNNVALYKNPSNLIDCAVQTFSIDSTAIISTNFAKISEEIQETISTQPEISIQFFFTTYNEKLSNEEINAPYIKQSILLLLYRWYFKSKYDREIPIDIELDK